jgi:hypothetical protein
VQPHCGASPTKPSLLFSSSPPSDTIIMWHEPGRRCPPDAWHVIEHERQCLTSCPTVSERQGRNRLMTMERKAHESKPKSLQAICLVACALTSSVSPKSPGRRRDFPGGHHGDMPASPASTRTLRAACRCRD